MAPKRYGPAVALENLVLGARASFGISACHWSAFPPPCRGVFGGGVDLLVWSLRAAAAFTGFCFFAAEVGIVFFFFG